MPVIVLEVPGKLESWNVGWRQNRFGQRDTNKDWRLRVLSATEPYQRSLMLTNVHLRITRFGKRAIDVDNIMAKPVIDGLKKAGVLREDDPACVRELSLRSEKAAGQEKVRIELSYPWSG